MRRRTANIYDVLAVIERYLQVPTWNQSKQRRSVSTATDRAKRRRAAGLECNIYKRGRQRSGLAMKARGGVKIK